MYTSHQQGLDPVFVTVLVVLAVISLALTVIYLENLHQTIEGISVEVGAD